MGKYKRIAIPTRSLPNLNLIIGAFTLILTNLTCYDPALVAPQHTCPVYVWILIDLDWGVHRIGRRKFSIASCKSFSRYFKDQCWGRGKCCAVTYFGKFSACRGGGVVLDFQWFVVVPYEVYQYSIVYTTRSVPQMIFFGIQLRLYV